MPDTSPCCIDIHTHVFPDALAPRAVSKLNAESSATAVLDGTLNGLLGAMDEAGIDLSVVLSIATRPKQFEAILDWSRTLARSPRILPFPSVHPADPRALEHLDRIHEEGFKGIKLHPYYQEFAVDEPRLMPIYERCIRNDLILLCHTGYDIAFPRDPIASPERIVRVLDRLPELTLVTSHFGAWEDWDAVVEHMVGRPIYMDVSYSMDYARPEVFRAILDGHPTEYLLFGSDAPWAHPRAAREQIATLLPDPIVREAVMGLNAARLLGVHPEK